MIVITGGSGFIGSNLVAALSERGVGPLVVCDRLDSDERQANLAKHNVAEIIEPGALFSWLAGAYWAGENDFPSWCVVGDDGNGLRLFVGQ